MTQTYVQGIVKRHFFRFFEAQRNHGDVVAEAAMLIALVHLDRAVQNGQLLLQQLQVGIDEAQLERDRLAQLLVARRPFILFVGWNRIEDTQNTSNVRLTVNTFDTRTATIDTFKK